MKGIKVINIGSNPEETQFGTCELCFSYGTADNPYMVLEFPDGAQVKHETYYWDWGDYYETTVANVVDFSAWLSEQELSDDDVEALKNDGKYTLILLINEYNWQLEETDDSLYVNRKNGVAYLYATQERGCFLSVVNE